jgi:arylsulfatase A-like enzyme
LNRDSPGNGKHVVDNGFQSPMLTEQAVHFLHSHYKDKATSDKPFFLFVGYTDTHMPHAEMPDDLLTQYGHVNFRDIPAEPFLKVHGETELPVSPNPQIEHNKRKEYYAAASSIDREVGKVLDQLESMGKLDDTLVVYAADHGLNAGHHGMWEKGNGTQPQNFLEESIRVPCTVSWPNGGIPRNFESNLVVDHCDLFMTLLDAAKALPSIQTARKINSPGRSYLSQLRGKEADNWKDYVVCEYGNARMIRTDGYKLILRYPFGGVEFANELYDLKADPRETNNLYALENPLYSGLIKSLSNQLNEFFSKYTAPGHSGLDMEHQPVATPQSPWLKAVEMRNATRS